MARVALWNCTYGRRRHDNIDARFVNRNRSSAERRLSSDLGEAAAKQAQRPARSARRARNWYVRVIVVSRATILVFRPSKLAAGAVFPAVGLVAAVEIWRRLQKGIFDPYRPELHYMRGPGPKWREKHAHAGSVRSMSRHQ